MLNENSALALYYMYQLYSFLYTRSIRLYHKPWRDLLPFLSTSLSLMASRWMDDDGDDGSRGIGCVSEEWIRSKIIAMPYNPAAALIVPFLIRSCRHSRRRQEFASSWSTAGSTGRPQCYVRTVPCWTGTGWPRRCASGTFRIPYPE